MLRLKTATSDVADFTSGTFQPVIGDPLAAAEAGAVDRVLLCSGKVYWELLAHRVRTGDRHTAIVRVEQLYPLDVDSARAALAPYPGAELVWVQEEPQNQGAWAFLSLHAPQVLGRPLSVVSRPESASTAAGSAKVHAAQHAELLDASFRR